MSSLNVIMSFNVTGSKNYEFMLPFTQLINVPFEKLAPMYISISIQIPDLELTIFLKKLSDTYLSFQWEIRTRKW